MARRLNKRKRKRREEYVLSERDKVSEGALSERTMLNLSKFVNKEIIKSIEHVIAVGKEADVYLARAGDSDSTLDKEYVAIKIFRIETSMFYKMQDYILGDPRFTSIGKTKSELIEIWCRKEYGNLLMAHEAGVNVPEPYMHYKNVLAMEFLGYPDGRQFPRLKDAKPSKEDAGELLGLIEKQIGMLYGAGLVHADLSEYNILIGDGVPYIIDMGQSVSTRHPSAAYFMRRDKETLARYFSKISSKL